MNEAPGVNVTWALPMPVAERRGVAFLSRHREEPSSACHPEEWTATEGSRSKLIERVAVSPEPRPRSLGFARDDRKNTP
jgi:hypothetical protein